MSEQNYSLVFNSSANYCASNLTSYFSSLYPSLSEPYAPAWNNHRKSANFLFIDGHTAAFKHTGAELFTSDWVSAR
jgi:prepilin-type processing-associated H-X9-DG protein